MATLEELVVSLVAETSGLRSELDKATKTTQSASKKMESALEEFTKNSSKNMSFFETTMATAMGFLGSQAVLGAFGLVKDAVSALGDELMKGADDARAEEVALTKLANSLALSGQYSKAAMDDLAAFAGEMEELTGVGDDVVASNLAVLSSITKLSSEGLKEAQRAALDLSKSFNIDLNTATNLVGKGITGNVSAFSRYGLVVEEGANKTENLANIMKALSGTQGSAAAAMKTFDGSLTKVNNSYGNFIESLATSVTKNQAVINVLGVVNGMFTDLTKSADEQNNGLKMLVAQGLSVFLESLAYTVTVIDLVVRAFQVLKGVIDTMALGLETLAAPITAIFRGVDETVKSLGESASQANKNLNAFGSEGDGVLASTATKLLEMKNAADAGMNAIAKGADATIKPTVAAQAAVEELSAAQVAYNDQLLSFSSSMAERGAALEGTYEYELELLRANLEEKAITEEEFFAARDELVLANQEAEQARLEEAKAKNLITQQQYTDALIGLERKQTLESRKNADEKVKYEELTNKQRTANLYSTLNTIATLSESGNKTLAAIGKAAAISTATIDGYAAVQKALASAPPPFNFGLAALVGVATAANIAKISGVGLNKGGTVPGMGPNVDSVPVLATPGEEVINRDTSNMLRNFLDRESNGQGASGRVTIELVLRDELVELVEARILERQTVGVSLLGAV